MFYVFFCCCHFYNGIKYFNGTSRKTICNTVCSFLSAAIYLFCFFYREKTWALNILLFLFLYFLFFSFYFPFLSILVSFCSIKMVEEVFQWRKESFWRSFLYYVLFLVNRSKEQWEMVLILHWNCLLLCFFLCCILKKNFL